VVVGNEGVGSREEVRKNIHGTTEGESKSQGYTQK
jgi:hypothetical protein